MNNNIKISSKVLRTEVLKALKEKQLAILSDILLTKADNRKYEAAKKKFLKSLVGSKIPKSAKINMCSRWTGHGKPTTEYLSIEIEAKHIGTFPKKDSRIGKYSSSELEEINKIIRTLEMSDEKYVSIRNFDGIYNYL